LNVPAAPSFSECAVTSVASRSITICSGRPPACHVRSRTAARAERSASVSSGSEAIRSITRKAVEPEATGPNSDAWSRSARRVGQAVAAVREHHRKVAHHPGRGRVPNGARAPGRDREKARS